MKYIKKFENIDWSFEDEENEINIENLKNYYIKYNTKEECMNIMNKLVELGYEVFGYGEYDDYDQWDGFVCNSKDWVQIINPGGSNVIYYNDIKNL